MASIPLEGWIQLQFNTLDQQMQLANPDRDLVANDFVCNRLDVEDLKTLDGTFGSYENPAVGVHVFKWETLESNPAHFEEGGVYNMQFVPTLDALVDGVPLANLIIPGSQFSIVSPQAGGGGNFAEVLPG